MTRTRKVCITRCEHCGLEVTSFRPAKGGCARCGRTFRIPRWISNPHPATVRQAEANDDVLKILTPHTDSGCDVEYNGRVYRLNGEVEMPGCECQFCGAVESEETVLYGSDDLVVCDGCLRKAGR